MIVVGVDVQTTLLALGDTTGRTSSLILRADKTGEWLADTYHRAGLFVEQFVNERPIDAVVIETPMGKYPSPSLLMTTGVVTAALYTALRGLYAHPVSVWPINISSWKKASVGHGNASKEQVMAWAHSQGLTTTVQDECDAYAIAVAGAALISTVAA